MTGEAFTWGSQSAAEAPAGAMPTTNAISAPLMKKRPCLRAASDFAMLPPCLTNHLRLAAPFVGNSLRIFRKGNLAQRTQFCYKCVVPPEGGQG